MVCSSVLLLIHGPIVMFVLGGVTGLVLANSETDLVIPAASHTMVIGARVAVMASSTGTCSFLSSHIGAHSAPVVGH